MNQWLFIIFGGTLLGTALCSLFPLSENKATGLFIFYNIIYLILISYMIPFWLLFILLLISSIVLLASNRMKKKSKGFRWNFKSVAIAAGMFAGIEAIWFLSGVHTNHSAPLQVSHPPAATVSSSELLHVFLTDHSLTLGITALVLMAVIVELNRNRNNEEKQENDA